MPSRKNSFFLTLATVLAVLLCSGAGKAKSDRGGKPPVEVTLAYVNTTHAVLAGVALHLGHFGQEGLQVNPRTHSFGKSALDDLLQGNADFATVADPPIMMAAMRGEKICVIATIQTSNKDNAVIAMRDRGIDAPEDLRGKRIGVTPGTTSDFFMDSFLITQGIAREEFQRVHMRPEELQGALSGGEIDAASAFQPFLIQMQRQFGERAISFSDENVYTWTFSVVAKQEFTRNNPETVRKFLRALLKAEEFVHRNTPEAQKIVADFSGVDIQLVRDIWPGMRFRVSLDQFLVLALEDESRWAVSRGEIPRSDIPNYLDFICPDGLESVKPGAVRILGRGASGR